MEEGLTERIVGLSLGSPSQQVAGLVCTAVLTLFVWRRYLSAISDIPGPFLASLSRIWHIHRILKGDQNLELIRLHDVHGALSLVILLHCSPCLYMAVFSFFLVSLLQATSRLSCVTRQSVKETLIDNCQRPLCPHRAQRGQHQPSRCRPQGARGTPT